MVTERGPLRLAMQAAGARRAATVDPLQLQSVLFTYSNSWPAQVSASAMRPDGAGHAASSGPEPGIPGVRTTDAPTLFLCRCVTVLGAWGGLYMRHLEQLAQVVAAESPRSRFCWIRMGQTCVVTWGRCSSKPVAAAADTCKLVFCWGRVSTGPGGPEPVSVGSPLAIQNGHWCWMPMGLAPLDSPAFTGTLSLGAVSSRLGFFGAVGETRPVITGSVPITARWHPYSRLCKTGLIN